MTYSTDRKHKLVIYHGHYKSLWYTDGAHHLKSLIETLNEAGLDYKLYMRGEGSSRSNLTDSV